MYMVLMDGARAAELSSLARLTEFQERKVCLDVPLTPNLGSQSHEHPIRGA